MKRIDCLLLICGLILAAGVVSAGTPTAHLLPLLGYVTDGSGTPLPTASVVVQIHGSPTGGTLVYSSGGDFVDAVQDGVLDLELGSVTPLLLDGSLLYYMSMEVDGQQVIGESSGGRYAFYPGGGSHDRADLEARLSALEAIFSPDKSGGTPEGAEPVPAPAFGGEGTSTRLELGTLGVGRFQGSVGDKSVVANMLNQPVGVFTAGGLTLELGPFRIPLKDGVTGVETPDVPEHTDYRGCYPNPFNPRTRIIFQLAEPSPVQLRLYDLRGHLVRDLSPQGVVPAGIHDVLWQGRDDFGHLAVSGVYLVCFQAGKLVRTQAITLIK